MVELVESQLCCSKTCSSAIDPATTWFLSLFPQLYQKSQNNQIKRTVVSLFLEPFKIEYFEQKNGRFVPLWTVKRKELIFLIGGNHIQPPFD